MVSRDIVVTDHSVCWCSGCIGLSVLFFSPSLFCVLYHPFVFIVHFTDLHIKCYPFVAHSFTCWYCKIAEDNALLYRHIHRDSSLKPPFILLTFSLPSLFILFSPPSHMRLPDFSLHGPEFVPGYNGADYRRQRGTAPQPRRDPDASSWTLPTRPTVCSGKSNTERSSCKHITDML